MSLTVLPPRGDRSRLSFWIFLIAWLIGNLALIAGFEGAAGFLENAFALCILAIACSAWWGAYKLCNFRNRGGLVVIVLWLVGPLVALLDFQETIRNPFFWCSTALLSSILGVALLTKARPESAGEARSK